MEFYFYALYTQPDTNIKSFWNHNWDAINFGHVWRCSRSFSAYFNWKTTLLLLEELAQSPGLLPAAPFTRCHITVINTHCWHLRNNLTRTLHYKAKCSSSRQSFPPHLLFSKAYGRAKRHDSLSWWVSYMASWQDGTSALSDGFFVPPALFGFFFVLDRQALLWIFSTLKWTFLKEQWSNSVCNLADTRIWRILLLSEYKLFIIGVIQ